MKKDDSVYLRHILDTISRIEEYTQGVKYEVFMGNYLIQEGVIRQIEIIVKLQIGYLRRLCKNTLKYHGKICRE